MNSVTLTGRQTKDPEIKNFESGAKNCKVFIATEDGWGDKKKTNFHTVVFWGKVVPNIMKYTAKGLLVAVTGSVNYEEWTNKDGITKRATTINGSTIEFLQFKPKPEESTPSGESTPPSDNAVVDDELPF